MVSMMLVGSRCTLNAVQSLIPTIIVNTYRRTNTLPKFLEVVIFFSIDISLEAQEIICRETMQLLNNPCTRTKNILFFQDGHSKIEQSNSSAIFHFNLQDFFIKMQFQTCCVDSQQIGFRERSSSLQIYRYQIF